MRAPYILLGFLLGTVLLSQKVDAVSCFGCLAHRPSCSARLASHGFSAAPDDLSGFCSGTMIDGSTLVTAAHCLDDLANGSYGAFDHQKRNFEIHIAVGESTSAQLSSFRRQNSVFSSSEVVSSQARNRLEKKGDLKILAEDIVIVKLATPIKIEDDKSCPKLPTANECEEVNRALASREAKHIRSNFYLSDSISDGGDFKKVLSVPSSSMIEATAQSSAIDSKNQFLTTSFMSNNKIVHLRKGDSGTGLIFATSTSDILIGVQSAMGKSDDSYAYFAQICRLVTDPKYEQFIGVTSVARPQESPVTISNTVKSNAVR